MKVWATPVGHEVMATTFMPVGGLPPGATALVVGAALAAPPLPATAWATTPSASSKTACGVVSKMRTVLGRSDRSTGPSATTTATSALARSSSEKLPCSPRWLMTFRPSLCPARAAADFRASPTMKLWAGPDWLAEIAKMLATGTLL